MRAALAALALLATAPAWAAPVVYECRAQQRNYPTETFSPFDNLIQPQMVFRIDGDSATVDDGLLRSVTGGPMPATIGQNTDAKLVLNWQLVAQGFGGRQASMLFRAALLKARNELIVTQAVSGSTTRFHARGACVTLPG